MQFRSSFVLIPLGIIFLVGLVIICVVSVMYFISNEPAPFVRDVNQFRIERAGGAGQNFPVSADFDNDGDFDLLRVSASAILVHYNEDNEIDSTPSVIADAPIVHDRVLLGDFDDNGFVDLIGDNVPIIYFNQ